MEEGQNSPVLSFPGQVAVQYSLVDRPGGRLEEGAGSS